MTVDEFMEKMNRSIRAGKITEDTVLKFRDHSVSDDAMEAGSDGYVEASEALIVDGAVYLITGEEVY